MRARILEQKPLIAGLLLCLAGIVVYANSFEGAFVFDDERTILANTHLESVFNSAHLKARRPVVRLSLAMNYAFGEHDPWGYHLVNLGVHLAAALLLFGLVRRTLRRFESMADVSARVAFVATLWWVVHPLQTESVTYIIQRAESMMGLFYFGVLYCTLRGSEGRRSGLWYGLAVASCLLGLASKAVILTAPFAALLYDRLFLARSFEEVFRKRKGLYLGLAATFGMLLVTGVLVAVLGMNKGHITTVGFGFAKGPDGISPKDYLLSQPAAILQYLKLTFWPVGQCVDYSWKPSELPKLVPGIVVLGLLALTAWGLKKAPRVGFLGVFFFLVLAPTSSFVPIRDVVFEHRMYVPLAAITVLVACAGCVALRRWVPPQSGPMIATLVVVVTAGGLGWATIERNKVYKSAVDFWQAVLDYNSEHARANENMAVHLGKADREDEVWPYLFKALELSPKSIGLKLRIAHLYMQEAKFAEGQPYLDSAFQFFELGGDKIAANFFRPQRAKAYYLKGAFIAAKAQADQRVKDAENAIPYFEEALRLAPRHVDARINMARCHGLLGRVGQAEKELLRALRHAEHEEELVDVHTDLALTYFIMKDLAKAETHARKVLGIEPSNSAAKVRLAYVEIRRNNREKALQYLSDVLSTEPNHGEAANLYRQLQAAQ